MYMGPVLGRRMNYRCFRGLFQSYFCESALKPIVPPQERWKWIFLFHSFCTHSLTLMTEGRTGRHVYRLPLLSILSSLPACMGAFLLNPYGALQSPDRSTTMLAAAFLQYQKRRSESFAFSKTTSSFQCILQVSGMGVQ